MAVSELRLAESDSELMDIVGEPEAVWRMVLRLPMSLRMMLLPTDWVFEALEVPTVVVSPVTVARNDEAPEPALSVTLLRAPSTRVEASAMTEEAISPIESVFWAYGGGSVSRRYVDAVIETYLGNGGNKRSEGNSRELHGDGICVGTEKVWCMVMNDRWL